MALAGCRGGERAVDAGARGTAMLDPARDRLIKPEALLARIGVAPGQTVADLGAGPGYLTLPLARAVGPGGRVIATDLDRGALDLLAARAREAGLANVEARAVAADDPGLAPSSVDLALLCHVDPLLPRRAEWLRKLAPALKPGGRLAVVGWAPGRAALLDDAARAGYALVDEDRALLPSQFLVLLGARRD